MYKISIKNVFTLVIVLLLSFSQINVNGAMTQSSDSGFYMIYSNYSGEAIGKIVYRYVQNDQIAVTTVEPHNFGVAPFHPYFAQSVNIDGETYFLSNTISGFELYNDSNGNGVIDSSEEIQYFVMLNATQAFTFSDITILKDENTTTYKWTSNYYDIDGFLFSSNSAGTPKAIIPSFNISYTVVERNSSTDLSVKFEIGEWDAYYVSFDGYNEVRGETIDLSGLSLSILYTSVIRSTSQLKITKSSEIGPLSDIKVSLDNKVLFATELNESYTLDDDSTPIGVITTIAPDNTFLNDQNLAWALSEDYIGQLKGMNSSITELPAIPEDNIPVQDILHYRIMYPEWSGNKIIHDPNYRTFKLGVITTNPSSSTQTSSSTESSNPQTGFDFPKIEGTSLVVISTIAGIAVLGLIFVIERRKP